MVRIVSDKNGDYDLSDVISITKIPQLQQVAPGQTRELPPVAKLHFHGGVAHSTLLPYVETREQWLTVKAAERHPADSESPQRTNTQ